MRTLVVSGSCHNYQKDAVFHQLTDVGVRGGGGCVGGDSESVDM
jgi:hypothetical protein